MTDDDLTTQIAAVRGRIAPALPANVSARGVELAAFWAVGRDELGQQTWHAARKAAEAARRSCWGLLRTRYGARDPHRGWLMFALLGAALGAAVAAVLASGFRLDPDDTAPAVVALALTAAAVDAVLLAVVRGRPVGRAAVRIQAVVTVAGVVAAAFEVSRGLSAPAVLTAGAAVVTVVTMAAVLIARARRRAETEEIDTAINVALADTKPEVAAVALRLQADTDAALRPDERSRIVALRTAVLADLAAEGITVASIADSVPAGGVIIDEQLATWVPDALRGEV